MKVQKLRAGPGFRRADKTRAQKTGSPKWPGRAARPGADP